MFLPTCFLVVDRVCAVISFCLSMYKAVSDMIFILYIQFTLAGGLPENADLDFDFGAWCLVLVTAHENWRERSERSRIVRARFKWRERQIVPHTIRIFVGWVVTFPYLKKLNQLVMYLNIHILYGCEAKV